MAETSEKVPIALAGPEDMEQCLPPAYTAITVKPSNSGRLLRIGAVVLISGALLLLFGAIGAFYFWKVNDKHIYNVHYTMSINGKIQEGSMEIDAGNNLETFKTGAGNDEAVEVHDFQIPCYTANYREYEPPTYQQRLSTQSCQLVHQNSQAGPATNFLLYDFSFPENEKFLKGITGIRFAGGEKCYIKAQAKAHIPDVDSVTKESLSFELEDEVMPARFDENSLIWVAADQPVKDNSFLSSKILELCADLPIFWLRPTYPKESQRGKRDVRRKGRQAQNLNLDQFEAAAEEVNTRRQGNRRAQRVNETRPSSERVTDFNPDNPYHQMEGEGGMTFDPMLDHQGICCIECRRSYTHCQRICEPFGGYYPFPYNYQGCRSACRVIMPCSWWVARILGVV